MTEEEGKKPLLLFECEINSETFWIAAPGLWQAVETLRSVEPDDESCEALSIEQCFQARAEARVFTDEDGSKRSMWEQFQRQTEPGLIASSVF